MLDSARAQVGFADGSTISIASSDLGPTPRSRGTDITFLAAQPSAGAGVDTAAGLDAVLAARDDRIAIVETDVESFREDPARRRRLAESQRRHPRTGLWLAVTGVRDPDSISREVDAARWAGFHTVGASIASPAAAVLASSIAAESDFLHIDVGRLALACAPSRERGGDAEPADEMLWHPSLASLLRMALGASAVVPTLVSVPACATAPWLTALFGAGARCLVLSDEQRSELDVLAAGLTTDDAVALAATLGSARGAADARRRVDAALSALQDARVLAAVV